ncbi:MAG: hypothetical protein KAU31_05245 [Spirochaetaceae bacterium]|nr:hypothetical protein [Spirochaetaceae bacterium]
MSTGRLPLTIVAVALLAVIFSGCTLQLEPPKLDVIIEPAYPSHNVLIPYELRGDGTYAQARWTLKRYRTDIGEWELVRSWEISVPNGSSGILQLERFNMYDARYELTVELLTSRGELSTAAPTLTSQAEFYVDTQSPWGNIVLNDNQGGGPDPMPPYLPGLQLEIYPVYDGTPDLNIESPVMLYHRIDSTVPPTDDQDPTGDTIIMWEGGEPSYSRILTIIAIDQAGNIGNYRVENYTAP